MLYIDKTYFTKQLSVSGTEEPTSDATTELNTSIDRYVSQFLKLTLGNVLFAELKSNTTNGELQNTAPQKWKNLIDGCNYTIDGIVYTWQGVRYTEGAFKVSLLANFVYCNQFQSNINSRLGQVLVEGKNSNVVDSTPHLVDIWNEFVEMYQGNSIYYRHSRVNTIDFDCITCENRPISGYVSYLQFLLDNKADYPNVPAQSIEYKNSLGL